MTSSRRLAASVPLSTSSTSDDERALIAAVRAGDEAAFERMVRRYYASLVTYAEQVMDGAADAEDVVQDVFIRIWGRHHEWVVKESLASYLFASVRNRAFNWQRDRRRIDHRHQALAVLDSHARDTEDMTLQHADTAVRLRDLDAALGRAISGLPARCREVYLLRTQHGLTRQETANVLGIALKTVEAQTTRAFRLLRAALADFL